MNKIRIFLVAGLMTLATGLAAQTSIIALQHDGQVTLYAYNELSSAISAAEAGDTIYLNEGTFTGGITIDKAITILGAGARRPPSAATS